MRIDKYLWAVRLYKTRSKASDACRNGKIKILDEPVKPSRDINPEQIFQIKMEGMWLTYQIKKLLPGRVKGAMVPEYLENITSPEVMNKLEELRKMKSFSINKSLKGRPTKKERRIWDRWLKS